MMLNWIAAPKSLPSKWHGKARQYRVEEQRRNRVPLGTAQVSRTLSKKP